VQLILGLIAGLHRPRTRSQRRLQRRQGPTSWAVSIVLGLVGAFVGYLIFTRGLGIGDNDAFDLGGLLSAIIGVVLVLAVAGFVVSRTGGHGHTHRPSTS